MSKHFICLVFLLAIFCVQGFAYEMKLHVLGKIRTKGSCESDQYVYQLRTRKVKPRVGFIF